MAHLSILTRMFVLASFLCLTDAQDVYVSSGDSVQLKCLFRVSSGQSLVWSKLNGQYYTYYTLNDQIRDTAPSNVRDRLTVTGNHGIGEYHLNISNTITSDSGLYECINYQTGGSYRQTLHIIDSPSSVHIENVSSDDKLLGTEGQDLTIRCTAEGGNPAPDVIILVSGMTSPSGQQSVQYTLKSVARSYDGQTVKCRASNNPSTPEQKTDTATIYLNLKPSSPVFSQDPVSTEEFKPFVVSCTSHGSRPAHTFTWIIGDGNINVTLNSTQQTVHKTTTDTYTVTSTLKYRVDRTYNRKNIVCGASNTATTMSVQSTAVLDVKYAPSVTVPNITLQQTQIPRTVQCVLDGNPAVFTFDKWQHRSKYGELIRELDGNSTLTLPTVPKDRLYQDTGEYACTAGNGIDDMNGTVKQTGSCYITSYALPVFTKDNSGSKVQFGEFGKNVMLFVNVYSVPKYSNKRWYRGNTELTLSKYVTSEEPTIVRDTFHGVDVKLDGYRVTLTINGLTQQDFDNYTLRLYSGGQYVEHMVVLESSSAPQSPTNLSTTDVTHFSITLMWIPGYDGGHQQTFHIQYRVKGSIEWRLVDALSDHNEQQSAFMSYTLTGLQDGTTYELRIYADNKFNSSLPTEIMNITTIQTAATDNKQAVGPVIGGVVGGLSLGVLLIIVMVVITRYRGRDLFGLGNCTNFPHFTSTCEKDIKGNQRQYDNIGMESNDSSYEEIENKGISKHIQQSETDAKSYETLGVKHKPNIYDDLKKKGIGQFKEAGREYESFGLNDKTKVNQQIDRRQGKTDNIYENERF